MQQAVRLGLVGLNFGQTVCDELVTHPELPVKLVKVCDLDPARAQAASQRFGVPISPSLEALLEDPAIDAIALYCGPNGRAALIRQIIRAGKDVMTTKPFEVDPDAALAVLHEARDLGRVVHLNSPNLRPIGEASVIQEWVGTGAIGRLTLGQTSVWCHYGPTPPDGTWYDDPRQCPVAPIFRLGIYQLNTLLMVFGRPETVQVTHRRVETFRPTPDNVSMTIGFADGAIINMMGSFAIGGPDTYKGSVTIAGSEGVIYHQPGPRARNAVPDSSVLFLTTKDRLEQREIFTHSGIYDWEFFAQRVRGEATADITTPEQVVAPLRVFEAAIKAEQSGATEQVRG